MLSSPPRLHSSKLKRSEGQREGGGAEGGKGREGLLALRRLESPREVVRSCKKGKEGTQGGAAEGEVPPSVLRRLSSRAPASARDLPCLHALALDRHLQALVSPEGPHCASPLRESGRFSY